MNGERTMPVLRPVLAGAFALLALTSVHHIYGAQRFGTPWRAHMAHIAGWIAVTMLVCVAVHRFAGSAAMRGAALWLLLVVIVVLPVGWIGFFEGGYNHVLKDVMYWVGAPGSLLARMFPPPTYEPPVDAWFEITGILQFPLAVWVGVRVVAIRPALPAS